MGAYETMLWSSCVGRGLNRDRPDKELHLSNLTLFEVPPSSAITADFVFTYHGSIQIHLVGPGPSLLPSGGSVWEDVFFALGRKRDHVSDKEMTD